MNLSQLSHHHDQLLRARAVCQASSYTILIFVILLPRICILSCSAPTNKTSSVTSNVVCSHKPISVVGNSLKKIVYHILYCDWSVQICVFLFLYWEGIQIQRETRPTQYTSVNARIFLRILETVLCFLICKLFPSPKDDKLPM